MNIKVSGVSRYFQNISDVPNSVIVIDKNTIEKRGYNDISDVLKDVVGFDVIDNAGQFGEFLTMRGIQGNDRILILINGHKINPPSGTHISLGNSLSIKYAERIEIIYGPASAVYGADAFSGIINIIYPQKLEDKKANFTTDFNYGSLNSYDASFKLMSNIGKDFTFSTIGRIYSSDGPNFENWGTTNYNYSLVTKYPSPLTPHFEQPSLGHTIFASIKYKNFSLNYFRKNFDEGNALSFIPNIYIYNKENKWKNSIDLIWLSYSYVLKNNINFNFDINLKRNVQDKNTIYYKWKIPNLFDANETYKQYMTGKDNDIHVVVSLSQTSNKKIQYIVGIEDEYSLSIPPYANDEVMGFSYKYENDTAEIIDKNLTILENRSAAFGQITYIPIYFLNLIFGARFDYSTRYGSIFNPRMGFIIKPFNKTLIKAIYGKAFQSPSLFFQYEQWGAPTVACVSITEIQKRDPNWKLNNQIVNSYELSVTQNFSQNYILKISGFINSLTNLIQRTMFAEYPNDSVYNKYFNKYTSGLRNENIGTQKIIGFELSFNAKISKYILLNTYYSFTNGLSIKNSNVEEKLPRIATNKIWITAEFINLFKIIDLSTRFRWADEYYNYNKVVFPDNKQPGFFCIDANLNIRLSKNIKIYGTFENILDSKYELPGLYEQLGIYPATIPQQRFGFKAGLEINFSK